MEHFSIKSAVDGLADEMKTRQMNKAQYMSLMRKRLDINYVNINELKPSRDGCEKSNNEAFYFKTVKRSTEFGVEYEKRIPIIANIDFLISFNYARAVDSPQK